MAMSPQRLAALRAHAERSGPEAENARRMLARLGNPVTMGGGAGGGGNIVRRLPGMGGPRAIGSGRNLPARRGGQLAIGGGQRALPSGAGKAMVATPVSLRKKRNYHTSIFRCN